jgi:cytochrome c-type biogenesis protein CcmE
MTKTQSRRTFILLAWLLGVGIIVALVLFALKQNINLFYTPAELAAAKIAPGVKIRVGGMVQLGSLRQDKDLRVNFVITDYKQDLEIEYQGVLPDLFREGQGVVVLGSLAPNHVFRAQQLLAKHDEKYMPPELVNIKQ